MSAALMTLFAVSILSALGLAAYGLRVLVGRWEQPRRPKVLLSVQPLAPASPTHPAPQATPPVWIRPALGAPAPMAPLIGIATPPPMQLPAAAAPASFAPPPAPPAPPASLAPPAHRRPSTPVVAPTPAWTPPVPPSRASSSAPRAPSPGPAAPRAASQGLSHRLARGSIPPEFSPDQEPDTDPGVPEITEPEPVVTRGARYSVIRSTRR